MSLRRLADRFWEKVDAQRPGECWLWTAHRSPNGYGVFWHKNSNHGAHRIAWMLSRGPIPEGMCVCHHCDVKHCCNPAHLFLGTHMDNEADKKRKGRGIFGERHHSSKLTNEQILKIRGLAGDISQKELATRYGVSRRNINYIVSHRTWQHLA